MHHTNLLDGVANLSGKAFIPTHMCDNPKIYTGRSVHGGKNNLKYSPSKDVGELKWCILIRDLWTQGIDSIHNMRVVNTDATSYQSKFPERCLETA